MSPDIISPIGAMRINEEEVEENTSIYEEEEKSIKQDPTEPCLDKSLSSKSKDSQDSVDMVYPHLNKTN